MTKFFFYDFNGKKQGPFSKQQIEELAIQGIIRPDARIETEDGHIVTLEVENDKHVERPPGFFDIHFTRFISNTWVTIIWVVIIIAHFLGALIAVFSAFNISGEVGMMAFLVTPLATALSLLFWRMALELDKVVFRIEKNTRETKDLLREIKEQLGKK